jgi:hypothetical protein
MVGNLNNNVMCCFCGETISLEEAVVLTVQSNIKNEEKQQLFSHRVCLVERVDKSVVLHPAFFDDDFDND